MKVTKRKNKFTRKEQNELLSIGKKGCSCCGEVLPLSCFGKQNNKIGYKSYCKYCRHVNDRKKNACTFLEKDDFWHKVNKKYEGWDRLYIKSIQRQYNISFKEAKNLSESEYCEICKKSKEDNGKRLAVDHCHTSGEIRGVLCSDCNTGLGMFKDNTNFLETAIEYLKKHKE